MTELYSQFYNKVGSKVSIINGNLTVSETGFLTVSTVPIAGTVYVDHFKKSAQVLPFKNDYRGLEWNLYTNNCAICCAKWHDDKYGTYLEKEFRGLTSDQKKHVMTNGYLDIFSNYGFSEISEISVGAILIYEHINHLAIVIDNNTILHHLARKFSSIDQLDVSKVQKILCYSKI
jgi:hypothetical protein